jgi:hypothetical protein
MVFVIESQHAAMRGVDPGYRATVSIDDNHDPDVLREFGKVSLGLRSLNFMHTKPR